MVSDMDAAKQNTALPLLRGAELSAWSGGAWDGAAADVCGVTQNGREMPAGGLYVALAGERFDGHSFVVQAQANGAAAAMVRSDWKRPDGVTMPLLRVPDTRTALGLMAAGRRRTLGTFIVGVTGSVGKTTTKELTAAALSGSATAYATKGNLNNDIGLPLTLLNMPHGVASAVVEAGSNHPGEIGYLCRILKPDAAIITAVAPVHIEYYSNEAAIAAEKADLIRSVPERGFAVIDAGGAHAAYLRSQAACRVVTVRLGTGGDADFCGVPRNLDDGVVAVSEYAGGASRILRSGLPGRHNALNLLLAVAAARSAGHDWEAIETGLSRMAALPMRWQQGQAGDIITINDAYNANPLSMRCALEAFAATTVRGRRVLVLGDMRELGKFSEQYHRELGTLVAGGPWNVLIAVGKDIGWSVTAAKGAGFAGEIHSFPDAAAAAAAICGLVAGGDTVLFKASRGIGLEVVEKALLEGKR